MARRRKPRGLTGEEAALWARVTSGARALRPGLADAPPKSPPRSAPDPKPKSPPGRESAKPGAARAPAPPVAAKPVIQRPHGPSAPASRPGVRVERAPGLIDALGPNAPGLDRRTAQKLRRGMRKPEARLDLHGMTAECAHAALNGFIRATHARGLRCVLVITGKGGRGDRDPGAAPFMPDRAGVLKHSVPRWLATAPLKPMIVGVFQAHIRHGGEGALYVYLKRFR